MQSCARHHQHVSEQVNMSMSFSKQMQRNHNMGAYAVAEIGMTVVPEPSA